MFSSKDSSARSSHSVPLYLRALIAAAGIGFLLFCDLRAYASRPFTQPLRMLALWRRIWFDRRPTSTGDRVPSPVLLLQATIP